MDFGTLLHTAKQNEHEKREVRYYSTKFSPPKKEKKESRNLSVNVQKFLARKEEEEKQKAEEAKKKREELLALRSQDKKATRRVNVMLKRTKSANQSVIQDAVDKDNTAVTLAGPSQPDEDDYGYVSQEASAFYNKMMEKYSKMPEEPKFSTSTAKRVSSNLSSTKDRVKAALEREREEAMMPHRRKRKHTSENEKNDANEDQELDRKDSSQQPNKPKSKPMPPPMNFMEILKLAEQKQHEPIVIQPKPKDDDGPLMTKKQRREHEKERQRLEAKEARMKAEKTSTDKNQKVKSTDNGFKVPKLSEPYINGHKSTSNGNVSSSSPKIPKINSLNSLKNDKRLEKSSTKNTNNKETPKLPSNNDLKEKQKQIMLREKQKLLDAKNKQKLEELRELQELQELREKQRQLQELERQKLQKLQKLKEKEKLIQSANNKVPSTTSKTPTDLNYAKQNQVTDRTMATSKFPAKAKDLQPKRFPPEDLQPKQSLKPKQFPPSDLKPKQFPPADVRQKLPPVKKRRILDDEEEYDPEMDDFIDDGPEDGADYSKYIRDIFGYDKNKYRNVDDDDVEEASFHQQWKEEIISTKIGIMEDLEDMKMEEAEKRRKAMLKKKRKL